MVSRASSSQGDEPAEECGECDPAVDPDAATEPQAEGAAGVRTSGVGAEGKEGPAGGQQPANGAEPDSVYAAALDQVGAPPWRDLDTCSPCNDLETLVTTAVCTWKRETLGNAVRRQVCVVAGRMIPCSMLCSPLPLPPRCTVCCRRRGWATTCRTGWRRAASRAAARACNCARCCSAPAGHSTHLSSWVGAEWVAWMQAAAAR